MLKTAFKIFMPGLLLSIILLGSLAFIPQDAPQLQDPGQQAAVFSGVVVTTTARSTVIACTQGAGSVGRKTLVVWNSPTVGGGVVTVTAELRDDLTSPNFTSGYLAAGAVATNTTGTDTSLPTEAGGRYCQVSAFSASTSTITVTLRRE